jgi:hypothetical protein
MERTIRRRLMLGTLIGVVATSLAGAGPAPTARPLAQMLATTHVRAKDSMYFATGSGAGAAFTAQTAVPLRPAVPLEPISAILEAFRTHAVVALGEGPHNNLQSHAFRLALIRDPRFPESVNDIVVESGSARSQDVMDRYLRGADVPDAVLRRVWEDSTMPNPVWDRPIYEEFFRAVRTMNASLPRDRQIRVLLGDPPIDWETLRNAQDYRTWLGFQRDSYPAELIRREVVARQRRALVIYGDGHLQAKSQRPGRSLAGILETAGTKVFTITSTFADLRKLQPDVGSWRVPSFAVLGGTVIGAAPYEFFFGPAPPVDYFRANPRVEDHYDAVLFLGAASSMTLAGLTYPRCADSAYIEMRVARMVLTGSAPTVADRLAKECAAAAPRQGEGARSRGAT